MARPAPLPLAVDELPQGIRKFCDPKAPAAARTMAARGMVPVRGPEQVMLLLQLSCDADTTIAKSANEGLEKLPEGVLHNAAEAPMPASFLDRMAEHFRAREDVLERLAANPALEAGTLEWIALRGSERVSERIAINEQRLLAAPRVIEALYKNKNTRMSTADRLIELAARNGVVLDLPTFEAHVAAIKGELIPEPSEEPLPSDLDFHAALAEDTDDPDVVAAGDEETAEEEVKEQYMPLMMRIRRMTSAEKLRLATVGNASARAFLVRDKNKTVAYAAITSPAMQEPEVIPIVRSKEVGEEILRYIGNKRDWTRSHEVKHGLVFNSKTPVGIALRFIGHLRDDELKALSRSRNVAQPLKSAALQRIAQKEKKDRGG